MTVLLLYLACAAPCEEKYQPEVGPEDCIRSYVAGDIVCPDAEDFDADIHALKECGPETFCSYPGPGCYYCVRKSHLEDWASSVCTCKVHYGSDIGGFPIANLDCPGDP